MKSGNLKFVEPPGPLQACNGTALPFCGGEKLKERGNLEESLSVEDGRIIFKWL